MNDVRIGTLKTRGGDGRQYVLYVYGHDAADLLSPGRVRYETKGGQVARPLPSGVLEMDGRDGPLRLVAEGPVKRVKR